MSALLPSTPLTRAVGIDVPLICGPMYPCSNPELVAAVSAAGKSLVSLCHRRCQGRARTKGGGGAPGGGNSGNGKPMDDSRIAGGQGAGEVTRRDLGDGASGAAPAASEEPVLSVPAMAMAVATIMAALSLAVVWALSGDRRTRTRRQPRRVAA